MDDRLTLGLYFELSNDEPATLAARAAELGTYDGVDRVSTWRCLAEGPTEAEGALPHRTSLTLGEVTPGFTPAPLADGDRIVLHFEQVRPSQGRLSKEPAEALWIVCVNPKGDEHAYRDWADFVHLPAILDAQLPGFRQVTPYRNAKTKGLPRFLHFWDLGTSTPGQSLQALRPAMVERFGDGTPEFQNWLAPPDGYTVVHHAPYVRA